MPSFLLLVGNGLCLERGREEAAVDEDVLAGDVAGMDRAQEGADLAEFRGGAETARRDGGDVMRDHDVDVVAVCARPIPMTGGEPLGVHLAGEDVVDSDVAVGDLTANSREIRGQPGA